MSTSTAQKSASTARAEKWAKSREVEFEDPSSALRQNNKPRTLASLIGWYIDTFEMISRWQRGRAVSH